jgi:RNA-directed DNA polymerase
MRHVYRLRKIVATHTAVPQSAIINRLNPVIRGWANYYSRVVSKDTYSKMDMHLHHLLMHWGKRRHPNKGKIWIAKKYFLSAGDGKWNFATQVHDKWKRLLVHSTTPIIRHSKVQGKRSPYDGDWVYWSIRLGHHPELSSEKSTLLRRQNGRCLHCGLYFKDGDLLEVDHVIPRVSGGKNTLQNKQILHRHCHDQKPAIENSKVAKDHCKLDIDERQNLKEEIREVCKDWNPYKPKKRLTDEEWCKQWN